MEEHTCGVATACVPQAQSGGGMTRMRYLTAVPIDREDLASLEAVAHGRTGAVVTFTGLVRADRQGSRTVTALDYEAYVPMAERQIEWLVADAQARWSLAAVHIRHRVGVVEAGHISVVVMVAAPHRAEAYAASQFLIERIKREVPVWKHECYNDAEATEDLHAHV